MEESEIWGEPTPATNGRLAKVGGVGTERNIGEESRCPEVLLVPHY